MSDKKDKIMDPNVAKLRKEQAATRPRNKSFKKGKENNQDSRLRGQTLEVSSTGNARSLRSPRLQYSRSAQKLQAENDKLNAENASTEKKYRKKATNPEYHLNDQVTSSSENLDILSESSISSSSGYPSVITSDSSMMDKTSLESSKLKDEYGNDDDCDNNINPLSILIESNELLSVRCQKIRQERKSYWEIKKSERFHETKKEIIKTKNCLNNTSQFLETLVVVLGSMKENLTEIKDSLVSQFQQGDFVPFQNNGNHL